MEGGQEASTLCPCLGLPSGVMTEHCWGRRWGQGALLLHGDLSWGCKGGGAGSPLGGAGSVVAPVHPDLHLPGGHLRLAGLTSHPLLWTPGLCLTLGLRLSGVPGP